MTLIACQDRRAVFQSPSRAADSALVRNRVADSKVQPLTHTSTIKAVRPPNPAKIHHHPCRNRSFNLPLDEFAPAFRVVSVDFAKARDRAAERRGMFVVVDGQGLRPKVVPKPVELINRRFDFMLRV